MDGKGGLHEGYAFLDDVFRVKTVLEKGTDDVVF
jgi:hypothetical protein